MLMTIHVHALLGDCRAPALALTLSPALVRVGANSCAFVAVQKSAIGSVWLPPMILHAMATEGYVWRRSRWVANGSVPGLNGDTLSLRGMNPGRKMR